MVRKLFETVVSIDQVSNILILIDGNKSVARSIPDFWIALRCAAARFQNEGGGILAFVEGEQEPRHVWWNEISSLASRMQVLFRIEKEAKVFDQRALVLKDFVLKKDGWLAIIQGSESNDSIARAARNLQSWISSSSDWPEEEIEQSVMALRSAVMTLLRGEDAWSISITSILELLDASLSVVASTWLTAEEISIVDSAALESVNTILNNVTDYNEVSSEVSSLGTLRVITESNYDYEVTRLNEFSNQLREKNEESKDEEVPRSHYTDEREESLDVDALFQGLRER